MRDVVVTVAAERASRYQGPNAARRHGCRCLQACRVATVVCVSAATETARSRGRLRIEQGQKRIRTYLGGELVADTIRPVLVWEVPYYPTYYFPAPDVRTEVLEADGTVAHSPSRGDGELFA